MNTEVVVGIFALGGTVLGSILGWIPAVIKWVCAGLQKRRGIQLIPFGCQREKADRAIFFFRLVNLDNEAVTVREIRPRFEWRRKEPTSEGEEYKHTPGFRCGAKIYQSREQAQIAFGKGGEPDLKVPQGDFVRFADFVSGQHLDGGAEVFLVGMTQPVDFWPPEGTRPAGNLIIEIICHDKTRKIRGHEISSFCIFDISSLRE